MASRKNKEDKDPLLPISSPSQHSSSSSSNDSPELSTSASLPKPSSGRKHSILSRSKDKGKEKIIPGSFPSPDPEENHEGDGHAATFIIKFSDGSIPDLKLDINNVTKLTTSRLRKEIRHLVGGITLNRRLRLIHSGRILSDQTDLAKDVARIHDDHDSELPISKVYIHCSIGDILSPAELASGNEHDTRVPTRTTLPELRGFDRLRASGFSDDDITQLRQQFSSIHGYGTATDSGNREELAQLEEQWIDTGVTDQADGTAALLGGDYLDDLIGILIGMFLGVFALFFMKESSLFSKRQQKALVAGVAVNFSFALLRLLM